jgi:hypothetical protein
MVAINQYGARRRFLSAAFAVGLLAAIAAPALAKGKGMSLSGKGTIQVSGEMACGADTCYSVSADFPASGGQHAISITVNGQGMTDPTTCKGKSGKSCCMTTMNLSFTFDESGAEVATFDCAFAGPQCDKPANSPTSETIKGKLICMDGTGVLEGLTGSGKLSANINPATGDGTVFGSLKIK